MQRVKPLTTIVVLSSQIKSWSCWNLCWTPVSTRWWTLMRCSLAMCLVEVPLTDVIFVVRQQQEWYITAKKLRYVVFVNLEKAFNSVPRKVLRWALTHWGRVTHICVGRITISGSDNGLSPGRRQAIIWTNAGILLIRCLGTGLGSNTYLYLQIQIQIQIRRICICICIWSNFKPRICICICIWSTVFGVFDKYVFKYTFSWAVF